LRGGYAKIVTARVAVRKEILRINKLC